jgi:hypothetical protein
MNDSNKLTKQALRTYQRITGRLDVAFEHQKKFTARGRRTTAYAALQGRIERLLKIQAKAQARYLRRQLKESR